GTFFEDNGNCQGSAGNFSGGLDVGVAGGNVEEHETDVLHMGAGRQNFDNGANCDFSGLVNRIAEDSGRYGREGQCSDSVVVGDADGLGIATGEPFGLALSASPVHWADSVNHIFGRQSSTGSDDGLAGGEGADLGHDALALLKDRGAASPVNGSIHPSATA